MGGLRQRHQAIPIAFGLADVHAPRAASMSPTCRRSSSPTRSPRLWSVKKNTRTTGSQRLLSGNLIAQFTDQSICTSTDWRMSSMKSAFRGMTTRPEKAIIGMLAIENSSMRFDRLRLCCLISKAKFGG